MKHLLIILIALTFKLNLGAQSIDSSISGNTVATADEGEAHIAINPTDSLKMVMGYMEVSQVGISFNVYHTSNGGNTWQKSNLNTASYILSDYPGYSAIGGGDIVFAYDKNGDLYCSWINLLANLSLASPLDTTIWTAYWAKSVDNGNNFTVSNGADHFFGRGKVGLNGAFTVYNYMEGVSDRQWMAVDLSNGVNQNNLYVGYINYPFNNQQSGLRVRSKLSGQNSFSPAVTAYAGGGQLTNIGVDSNGILHYTFCDIVLDMVYHVSSVDGGQTFSTPHLINNGVNLFPNTSNSFVNDRENAAPSLAIDGANNLHLVWGEFPNNQQPLGYYSVSTNGGQTWSTPLDLSTLFGSSVFMPVVSAKNNRVTIGSNILDFAKKSEYHIITSSNNGTSFASPVKVSSGITDFTAIGLTPFVGDYSSAVRTNCNIYSLWTDCRANGCKQYIAKYDECLSTGLAELTPINSTFSLSNIFPVPTVNVLNLVIESQIVDNLIIEIYNNSGQKVKSENYLVNNGENRIELKLDEVSSGQYIMRLINKNGTYITRTFIKK